MLLANKLSHTQFDYTNCDHSFKRRAGRHPNGKQRWECCFCKRRFTEGGQVRGFAIFAAVAPLFKEGLSIRQAALKSNFSRTAVSRCFNQMVTYQPLCKCGRKRLHIGCCKTFRINFNQKRKRRK